MHGPIAHEAVPAALASIDALAVPSIWPENSPLVIREAFLAGAPVVAFRIGGIPGGRRRRRQWPARRARRCGRHATRPRPSRRGSRAARTPARRRGRVSGSGPGGRCGGDGAALRVAREAFDPDAPSRSGRAPLWRSRETRLAVRSLLASRRTIDDLIVVDNDPARRCVVALEDARDRIVYLESPRNLGYAGGMNLGIREALARGAVRVFLVNNDVMCRQTPSAGSKGP